MKHIKPRDKFSKSIDLSKFTPVGKKDCEGRCDREVVMTKEGPVVICNGCNRVVMDNRK